MALVTFISDLGLKDYYSAAVKGAIITHCEQVVPVVDVTHLVKPFDIREAAFALRNSYRYFPKGTIHIVHVNSSDARGRLLLAKHEGHYILTFDNGILSLAFGKTPLETYQINEELTEGSTLLHEEAIGKVINLVLQEYKPSDFGHLSTEVVSFRSIQPIVGSNSIRGTITYIDNYGNAISNITEQMLYDFTQGRKFTVLVNVGSVRNISKTYSDVEEGEILCLVNSSGLLEIAINKGKAVNLLGLKEESTVIISLD